MAAAPVNAIFQVDKRYLQEKKPRLINTPCVGSFIQDNSFKGMGISPSKIQSIICKCTDVDGVCQRQEISHGDLNRPIKTIVDKTTYDALIAFIGS